MKVKILIIPLLVSFSFLLGAVFNANMALENRAELSFPFDYLPKKDRLGGTESLATFSGEISYRSYPSKNITLSKEIYSNTKRYASTTFELSKDNKVITDTLYFDVDKDGKKEKIISICSDGANHCPDSQEVIKNNQIIFTLNRYEIGGFIEPTETGNGFYANWFSKDEFKNRSLCCATGNIRTRFIYENERFVPIFEQKVGYVKVNNK